MRRAVADLRAREGMASRNRPALCRAPALGFYVEPAPSPYGLG